MSNTSIVAALAGLGFSLILIRILLRADWNDRWTRRCTDWHHAESPVPRLGGAILVCWFLGLVSWVTVFRPALRAATAEQDSIVIASISMFALGFCDDFHPIGAGKKLFIQLLIAAGACWAGLELVVVKTPFSAVPVHLGLWGPIVTVAWLVAVPNLINLVDGCDGLAGGIGLTSMVLLGVMAQRHGILGLLAFGMVGALLGFLRYNFPPARIYLGDGGAYFLGFLVAALALANADHGTAFQAMGATMVLLSVPLADAAFTVLRRGVRGLPLLRPDRRHLHHRLLALGRSRQGPLLWVYSLNLVLFAFGLMIYYSPAARWPWLLGAIVSLLLILAGCCGGSPPYFAIWTKIRSCWRMRGQVHYALSLVRWLELEAKTANGPGDLWPDLIFTADKLGLAAVTFKRNREQRSWRKTVGLSGPVRRYPLGNGRYGTLELEAPACVRGKSEPNAECEAEGACRFGKRGCLLEPRVLDTITELIAEAWNKAATQWQARQSPSGCGAVRRSFPVGTKLPHKSCVKATALLVLISLLPCTLNGAPLLDTNYFAWKLRGVARAELPARAGALVRKALPELRSAAAVEVVRLAALINPMAVANTVCEVSRADPGSVTIIAQAATREQPEFATDIARAATLAVPLQAGEIMAGVGKCVPDGLRDLAVAIAAVEPSAAREILAAVGSIRPDLKPHLEAEINRCGSRIPSVGRCFDRAELVGSQVTRENPATVRTPHPRPPSPKPPRGTASPPGGRNYARP
jgi:UDP-GlcNAc:undecaprenyl-phosphate GlcNAc-1-phosphate transferase